jgi:cyclopropane-fatty-acyl-phospholipid synthase
MRLLASLLGLIVKTGRLILIDSEGRQCELGDGAGSPLILRLNDKHVALEIAWNPNLKFGEAYMDGRVSIENGTIADVLELFARNMGTGSGSGHMEWLTKARYLARRLMQRNGVAIARRNVATHYDLSAALYDLFLDADKQYSCAFYEKPTDTLDTAQQNKKRRIAAKLNLKPGQRVLDIGSGWGGMALHLSETAHADVTGITLSTEQLKVANDRAADASRSDRVHFRLEDYRLIDEKFDRIVSVGMFEHVGLSNYETYFKKVAALLEDDGVALIHTIGRGDGPGVTNPWIAKYIFPGGYTPALSEILPAVEKAGLIVTDVETLRLHYAMTLADWRRRFMANWEAAKSLYDERFCRMWEFYLAGAEMGFRYQGLVVFQLQLAKRVDALPIVRDYMMPARKEPERGKREPLRKVG